MTITRTGSNEKYASNWESIFGKSKGKKATVAPAPKKASTKATTKGKKPKAAKATSKSKTAK